MHASPLFLSALAGLLSLGITSPGFAQGTHWTIYGDAAYTGEGRGIIGITDAFYTAPLWSVTVPQSSRGRARVSVNGRSRVDADR